MQRTHTVRDSFALQPPKAAAWKLGMMKVFPNAPSPVTEKPAISGAATVLTVWHKSLLFNCSGFTVYDADGNLVFRVDNYSSGNKAEIVLMDGTGEPLFTFRRRKLILVARWWVYDGKDTVNPRFSVEKNVGLHRSKVVARVTKRRSSPSSGYEIEGSYGQRSCVVYGEERRKVAEIRVKEAAARGANVFHLVVEPGVKASLAMGIVVLLDQMFGSRGHLTKI